MLPFHVIRLEAWFKITVSMSVSQVFGIGIISIILDCIGHIATVHHSFRLSSYR